VRRAAAGGESAPSFGATGATTASGGGGDDGGGPAAAHQAHGAAPRHRESATARLDRIDELVALIEERVLAELERRGGRHRGWI